MNERAVLETISCLGMMGVLAQYVTSNSRMLFMTVK